MTPASANPRYEFHESPPVLVAAGVGLQFTVVASIETLVGPVIVAKGSGGSDAFLLWLVFATLIVIGVSTLLQTVRLGPIGTGAPFPMYMSFAAIPFCIMALVDGGPATMMALVLVSAAFQIIFSRWLFYIRRIITPTVYGTVMMLIAFSLISVMSGLMIEAPMSSPWSAPVAALATLAVIVAITLRGSDALRLWAPLCGIAAGCAAAVIMGIYDFGIVAQASWVGVPPDAWPLLVNGLDFGASFWSLVPVFLFLSVIISLQTGGTFISLHQSSWRQVRAVDFREVQRSISTAGAGNLIAGLAGAAPNIGALTMVSFVQITGVASRKIGYWVAGAFIALAFLPKLSGLFAGIPGPVMTGFIVAVAAVMFSEGARTVVQDGLDRRKVVIVGVSVLVGAAFEFRLLPLPELHSVYESLLKSGIVAGGLTAIVLNLFMNLTAPRRMRFRSALDVEALPDLNAFISKFTERQGWGSEMTDRVSAAAEETLLTLVQGLGENDRDKWRMLVLASRDGPVAVLEFIGAASAENLEDRIRQLQEQAVEAPAWPEFSIRLLTHYSSSVRHQRYHDADVITIRIDPPVAR